MHVQDSKKLTPFGKIIKKRLVDLDMKQSDLARLLGTSEAHITYILYGDRCVDKWVEPICMVLGIERTGEIREGAYSVSVRKQRQRA